MTNWQTKKLGDVMDFIPTGAHSRNDMTSATDNPNQVFNIHYGDIHTKYFTYVNLDKDIVPVLIENTVRDNMRLQDGDLVVADASEDYDGVGSSVELRNVSERKVIGGLHTFALRSKNDEFTSGFTGLILKNPATHKRLMQMSVYSKVYGLTKSSIASVDVSYPEKPEQERIVGVLEVWDEYIEKLEQKIALKEQLKKGLMQQLLTGKRRLPGFNNKWQVSSIGEVSEFINGYTFLSSSYVNDGKFKIITIANVQDGRMDSESAKTIMGLPKNINDQQMLKVGDIIISMTGNVGRTCRVDIENGLLNQRVGKIVANKTVRSDYLYYLLQSRHFLAKMIERAQGGAQDNLSAKDIKKYRIVLPTYDEQTAIANILCSADFTISGLKSKKDAIVKQKQYLLKNLITGTIRTLEDLKPLDISRLERSAL